MSLPVAVHQKTILLGRGNYRRVRCKRWLRGERAGLLLLLMVVIIEGRDLQLMDGRLRGRFYVCQIWRRNGVNRAVLGRRRQSGLGHQLEVIKKPLLVILCRKKKYETHRFQLFIHDLARFGPRWRTLELGLQVQVQHER